MNFRDPQVSEKLVPVFETRHSRASQHEAIQNRTEEDDGPRCFLSSLPLLCPTTFYAALSSASSVRAARSSCVKTTVCRAHEDADAEQAQQVGGWNVGLHANKSKAWRAQVEHQSPLAHEGPSVDKRKAPRLLY